ncbi:sulfurtransferase [Thiomicrorhabdus sp.]|uniref:sulfurtransferase n=1 Tax=Thiomicrorhabdus sp. TaxID=2039724 RepID=UPI0035626C14
MVRYRLSRQYLALLASLLFCLSQPAFAEQPLRLSVEQLQQQLNSPNLVILDSRSPEDYQQNHIPGALNFPEVWTYIDKQIDGRIAQPARIQNLLQSLGINTDTSLVIYDDGKMANAARVFWTLEVYGFTDVRVLDQGYDAWLDHNYPVDDLIPKTQTSNYIPTLNHDRLATKLTTLIASKTPNQIIIDARPNDAYKGLVSSAKRFGHIPTAINIPASHNLAEDHQLTHLKSTHELNELYSFIPKKSKIIIYCAIGRISATNYLALRELGYNVANYDASWKEWGNDITLPIER